MVFELTIAQLQEKVKEKDRNIARLKKEMQETIQQIVDSLAHLQAVEEREEQVRQLREAKNQKEGRVREEAKMEELKEVSTSERLSAKLWRMLEVAWGQGGCTPCDGKLLECKPQPGPPSDRACKECKDQHIQCYWGSQPRENLKQDGKGKAQVEPKDLDDDVEVVTEFQAQALFKAVYQGETLSEEAQGASI